MFTLPADINLQSLWDGFVRDYLQNMATYNVAFAGALATIGGFIGRKLINSEERKTRKRLLAAYEETIRETYQLNNWKSVFRFKTSLKKEIYRKQIRIAEEWALLQPVIQSQGVAAELIRPIPFYTSLAQRLKLEDMKNWADEMREALDQYQYLLQPPAEPAKKARQPGTKRTSKLTKEEHSWLWTWCGFSTEETEAIRLDLSEDDVPETLRKTIRTFYQVAKADQHQLQHTAVATRYLVSIRSYTHLGEAMVQIQEALAAFFKLKQSGIEKRFLNNDFFVSVQENTVATNRVLYLFPFFLVPSRRGKYGVLPFARQTMAGIVLHHQHPAFQSIHQFGEPGSTIVRVPQSESGEWLERVAIATEEAGAPIYCVNGFVFAEILNEVLAGRRSPAAKNALVSCQSPINFEDQDKRSCFSGPAADPQNSLFVFDPAESLRLLPKLHLDYRIVICKHELDIPIGIGFNLPMLPSLVRNRNWRSLQQEASTRYMPLIDELNQWGIEHL